MEIISPKSYQIVDLLIKNSDLFLAEEYKRVLGDRKKNLLSTYVTAAKSKGINLLGNNMVSLRRKPHENYSVNITLPPMEFFLRGCARSYHTGCIMVTRPQNKVSILESSNYLTFDMQFRTSLDQECTTRTASATETSATATCPAPTTAASSSRPGWHSSSTSSCGSLTELY